MALSPEGGPGPPGDVPNSDAAKLDGGKRAGTEQRPKPMGSAHLAVLTMPYPERSLFVLRKRNPIRSTCVVVSHHKLFDHFILSCILCNCVTLGMSSNRKGFDGTTLGITLNKLEYLWVAIFTTEALLKIVSMGFMLVPGTYLRDGWNVVDFLVVVLGFVDLFTAGNLTALRTVRVLRPLRAITRVRGMRVLVTTLLGSLPMLVDVFILCGFTFFIYGLVAVQLFAGVLKYRCGTPVFDNAYALPDGGVSGRQVYYNVTYAVDVLGDAATDVCSGPLAADTSWYNISGVPVASHGPGGGGHVCQSGTFCTAFENPNYGMTSFDHIIWAWLTILQCITQESWTDVMYYASDALSWWVWPFFVALVIFGSFYMINLALAVLYVQFMAFNEEEKRKARQAAALSNSRNDQPGDGAHGDGGCSDDESESGSLASNDSVRRALEARDGKATKDNFSSQGGVVPMFTTTEFQAMHPLRRAAYRLAASKRAEHTTMLVIILNTVLMCINWYRIPATVEYVTNVINYVFTWYFFLELIVKLVAFGVTRYFHSGMNTFDCIVVVISMTEFVMDVIPSVSGVGPLAVLRAFRLLRVFRLARSWKALHAIIRAVYRSVTSTTYLLLLTLLFLCISALMGMQLFGYKFMFCNYVDGARPVCPLGMRVWGDCPDHFYCYLPCTADDYGSWVSAPGSFYNNQAYCERFCATQAASDTADGNATAAAVAAGGGCEYLAMVGKSDVPRANFDTLLWGLYTVFQLLTTENWNNIMYDAMRSTTPWAAVYVVAVLLVGTYLVFNLFVAILLDNFAGTFDNAGDSSTQSTETQQPLRSDSDSDSSEDPLVSLRTDLSSCSIHHSEPGASESGAAEVGLQDPHPLLVASDAYAGAADAGRAPDSRYSIASPGSQQVLDIPDSPSDVGPGPLKGVKRKVVPINQDGWSPAGALRPGSARPNSRPATAADARPSSATKGGVRFSDSAMAPRHASSVSVHEVGSWGLAHSLQLWLKRAVSWIDSIREVRRNEHLAKFIRGRSLLLLDSKHWLRWRAARLVHDTHFEAVVLLLIAASSVTLALDTPSVQPSSRLAVALRYCDYVFVAAFAMEAVLKIITFGFAFTGKDAYIRSGWNILDFLIVLVGFTLIAVEALGVDGSSLQMLRVLRTFRAMRPLRAASRYEGLKLVVNALFAVLPAMGNVALVCALFYLIFAILSVNLFKGQLYNCINADTGDRLDPFYVLPPGQTLTSGWCQAGSVTINSSVYTAVRNITLPAYEMSTAWVHPQATFDNIGVALLSLFQIATLELWVDIAFSAVDAVGVDKQPLWNHRPQMLLLFVVTIIVCSFFVLNLFVGVILEKFTEMQQAQTSSGVFVTPHQQIWVDVQKLLMRTSMQLRPSRPDEPPWRERLYDFVASAAFHNFILGAILVNVLFMAMVHADMTSAWQACMSYTNAIFTAVFLVEAVLKIVAFGAHGYFRDKWNVFDFSVVVISLASVVLDFSDTKNLSFMPVLRMLRVVRVFRLVRRAKGLQRLLMTLVHSLPALGNVGGVMLLVFFCYAVVGMNLFGAIKHGDYLNRHANFQNFPNSMLVLMRMLTGESWDGIMHDCMKMSDCVLVTADTLSPATNATLAAGTYLGPKDPLLAGVSDDYLNNQCPLSPWAAIFYFPTFVILCSLILLNLVIAVILENMITAETDEGLPVSKSLIGRFVDAWSAVDPAATGFIHASRLPLLIGALDSPMGTKGNNRQAAHAVVMSVDIPLHAFNTVTFMETLHALAGRIAGTELPEIEEDWLLERFAKRLPGGGASFPKYTAAHFHASLYVQSAIRGFMARHKMRGMMQTFAGKPAGPDALLGAKAA